MAKHSGDDTNEKLQLHTHGIATDWSFVDFDSCFLSRIHETSPLTEAELPLSESVRLVTGGSIGGAIFKIEQNPEKDAPKLTSLETQGDPKTDDEFDFTPMARVRLQLLYGRKQGLQYGFGVHAIFYDGIDRPEIKANRPMRWGLDLSAAYTWRGF